MGAVESVVSTVSSPGSRWPAMARACGVIGLVSIVALFASVIAISSLGEPPLDAAVDDVLTFVRRTEVGWYPIAEMIFVLAMLGMLWFLVGLGLILRRAEGDPAWRSTVALLSGLLFVAYGLLDVSWESAAHRAGEISRELAAYAFDHGNLGFVNVWLAMASLAVAVGWLTLSTRVLPRWIGWCALISAVGLVVARVFWFVEPVWFGPYALFWIWLIGTCIRLIRRPPDPG